MVEHSKVLYQDLQNFKVPDGFRTRSKLFIQLWWIVEAIFFHTSPQFLFAYRCWLLRVFGAKIGRSVKIRSSVRVTYPWNLEVGDYSWLGDDTVIYNLESVKIGSNVAIAHGVYICTGLHDIKSISFNIVAKPVIIEDEVWLANDTFIGPGVSVGRGSVIGARSSVFSDMPSGMLCLGYPAKPIRPRH